MVGGPLGEPVSKNNWQFELFLLTGLRVSNRNHMTWQIEIPVQDVVADVFGKFAAVASDRMVLNSGMDKGIMPSRWQ